MLVGIALASTLAAGGSSPVAATSLPANLPEADQLAVEQAADDESTAEEPTETEVEVEVDDPDGLIAEAIELGLLDEAEVTGPVMAGLVAAVPTVGSAKPSSGPLEGDQIVVISGKDWGTVSKVEFGTEEATSYAVASASQIVARAPDASAGGAVTIKVTNGDGTNSTGATYTYIAPEVTKITPLYASDSAAAEVTITGKGFTGAVAADVKFGTFASTEIWVVSDTQIVAMSPVDDNGNSIDVTNGVVDVTVTRNSVASTASAASKFLFTPGLPTITGLTDGTNAVTSTSGADVGDTLTIEGTNLWGVTQVNFGTVKVLTNITVNNDGDELTVPVPANKPGPIDITVQNVRGTSAVNLSTDFTYISSTAPKITTVTPSVLSKAASGGGGTFLVTGTGFSGMGTSHVTIACASDVTPTAVVVVSDTSMIVTAPGNGDTAAVCDLTVENPADNAKTSTLADAISYV